MITTVEDVKELLGIDNETFDVRIAKLIPYCEQMYKNIRNAPWDTVGSLTSSEESLPDDTIVYPVGSDVTIANMVSYLLNNKMGEANISSESMNSYSVSYGDGSTFMGFPRSVVGSIKKYVGGR
jgi:hypothetical protein